VVLGSAPSLERCADLWLSWEDVVGGRCILYRKPGTLHSAGPSEREGELLLGSSCW